MPFATTPDYEGRVSVARLCERFYLDAGALRPS